MNDVNPKHDPAYEDVTPSADLCSEKRCAEYRDEIECRLQAFEAKLRAAELQIGELKKERDSICAQQATLYVKHQERGEELDKANRLNEAMRKALEEIVTMGRVCKDFELCDHPACSDSCGAVLVAIEGLKGCPPRPSIPCPPAPVVPPCAKCWRDINNRLIHQGPCDCDCHKEQQTEKPKGDPVCECGQPAIQHGGCRNYRPKPEPWTNEQKAVLAEGLDALQKKFPVVEKRVQEPQKEYDGPPCPQAKDGHRFNKWGICMRCNGTR